MSGLKKKYTCNMEIPKQPSTNKYYGLNEEEKNCLNYYCVFKVPKTAAFGTFLCHEPLTKQQIKRGADLFFSMSNVMEYIVDYNATLKEVFEGKKEQDDVSDESLDKRTKRAIKKLKSLLCDMAEKPESEIDFELLLKAFDKLRLFDEEEEQIEQPRRYLPEHCSACRYKAFCEQECDDLCQRCNYKAFANEQGVEYPNEKQLSNEPKG